MMFATDRFSHFDRLAEWTAGCNGLHFEDLVRIADSADLSLAEVATALRAMEASGRWERVTLDARGIPLSPAQANAIIRAQGLGLGDELTTVWRRRVDAVLLA